MLTDEYYMRSALKLAEQAYEEEEVPVGAVIVADGLIIAKAYNQTQRLNDVTAHAEIVAITAASNYLSSKYLPECTLYVTLEPCAMCAGAIAWAQIGRLVFGASDEKRGYRRYSEQILHPKTLVKEGVLGYEAAGLMQSFFRRKR